MPKDKLHYIMGNPPFVGYKLQTTSQKEDLRPLYGNVKNIDYVSGWYFRASQLMENTAIRTAFVSTNSITQGEQVSSVWKPLYDRFGIHIDFAYRTFRWSSEAKENAAVHCVIVGFSIAESKKTKRIYLDDRYQEAENINAYLVGAEDVFVEKRSKPICDVQQMIYGSEPREGGNLLLTEEERIQLIQETPQAESVVKRFVSSEDFINNKVRYCLWISPKDLIWVRKSKFLMKRLEQCKVFREHSKQVQAHASADRPWEFTSPRQPHTTYLLIPVVSSEQRKYIPIGYVEPNVIASNACFMVPDASKYTFGILTSNVHMAWMRTVCGRLKSDYRYSNTMVYNNFPWPTPTDEQKAKIEQTAQAILDARALYPDCSLADLYDEVTMPPELRRAHQENDRAVMRAYGFTKNENTESACVAALMKLYQELVEREEKTKR